MLVVESFVDESIYRGTCYHACGFEALGPTGGFARDSRDFYVPHERPKQLYVRGLRPRAVNLLRQARLPEALADHEANVARPATRPSGASWSTSNPVSSPRWWGNG